MHEYILQCVRNAGVLLLPRLGLHLCLPFIHSDQEASYLTLHNKVIKVLLACYFRMLLKRKIAFPIFLQPSSMWDKYITSQLSVTDR